MGKPVSHCIRGHAFTEENTVHVEFHYADGRVQKKRQCRICQNARTRKWSARQRAQMRAEKKMMPLVEPDVSIVPTASIPSTYRRVVPSFWRNLFGRLKLLDDGDSLCVNFHDIPVSYPTSLHHIARREGYNVVKVIYENKIYVSIVRRPRKQ